MNFLKIYFPPLGKFKSVVEGFSAFAFLSTYPPVMQTGPDGITSGEWLEVRRKPEVLN